MRTSVEASDLIPIAGVADAGGVGRELCALFGVARPREGHGAVPMDRVNDDGGEESTHHEISRPSLAAVPYECGYVSVTRLGQRPAANK